MPIGATIQCNACKQTIVQHAFHKWCRPCFKIYERERARRFRASGPAAKRAEPFRLPLPIVTVRVDGPPIPRAPDPAQPTRVTLRDAIGALRTLERFFVAAQAAIEAAGIHEDGVTTTTAPPPRAPAPAPEPPRPPSKAAAPTTGTPINERALARSLALWKGRKEAALRAAEADSISLGAAAAPEPDEEPADHPA